MKVSILTRRYGDNFGSALQAYALQIVVGRIVKDSVVLNYNELSHNIRWMIRPKLYDFLYTFFIFTPIKFLFKKKYEWLNNRNIQKEKFSRFDNLLNKTKQILKSSKDLADACKNSDVCVCGSDQIWNPFLFDKNFYLSFLKGTHTKKIAYAVSLGINDPSLITSQMIDLIKDIDFISMREDSGREIVYELTQKNIVRTLDPTLLLNKKDWEYVKSDYSISEDYILCYFLKTEIIPNPMIQQLKEKYRCKVVNIQMYYALNFVDADIHLYDVGPQDFLSLVSNAKCICTNSFHGTVFSLIFEKEFLVFDRFKYNAKNNQNSRIDDLLRIIDLESRKMKDTQLLITEKEIEYPLKCNFEELKDKSLDFLKKTILSER